MNFEAVNCRSLEMSKPNYHWDNSFKAAVSCRYGIITLAIRQCFLTQNIEEDFGISGDLGPSFCKIYFLLELSVRLKEIEWDQTRKSHFSTSNRVILNDLPHKATQFNKFAKCHSRAASATTSFPLAWSWPCSSSNSSPSTTYHHASHLREPTSSPAIQTATFSLQVCLPLQVEPPTASFRIASPCTRISKIHPTSSQLPLQLTSPQAQTTLLWTIASPWQITASTFNFKASLTRGPLHQESWTAPQRITLWWR